MFTRPIIQFEWYNFVMVLAQYAVPLCIISVTYGRMSVVRSE